MNIKIDKHLKSPKISAALFDLDGTILNQKEEIPEEIVLRIKHISKIVPTSLVSGRIFSSVYEYSKILGIFETFGTFEIVRTFEIFQIFEIFKYFEYKKYLNILNIRNTRIFQIFRIFDILECFEYSKLHQSKTPIRCLKFQGSTMRVL